MGDGDELGQPPGDGVASGALPVGTRLIDADGNEVIIAAYKGDPPMAYIAGPPKATLGSAWGRVPTTKQTQVPLKAGAYDVPGLNKRLNLSPTGEIVAQGAPTGGDYRVDGKTGLVVDGQGNIAPQWVQEALGALPEGFGSGGSQPRGPVGAQAPDPFAVITALYKKYEAEVAAGNAPHEDALDALDTQIKEITQRYNYEQAKGTFEQTAATTEADLGQRHDQQLIDIAKDTNTQMFNRDEARANRGIDIATQRRMAGTSFAQDMLPKSVPAGFQLPRLPFFGEAPATRVNPDQVYGLSTLGDIPDISPGLAAQYPTPREVPRIPVPAMTAPGPYTQVPPRNIPPPPSIEQWIDMLASGFGGF